jgi:hypothetical protein
MSKMSGLDELMRDVKEAEGGVLITNGERLREAVGITRLKEKARLRVQETLGSVGLRALPEVPRYQHEEVYVVQTSTAPEFLFAALHNPSKQALRKHVLPAVRGSRRSVVSGVAVSDLGELLDEAKELIAEIESGEPHIRRDSE